MAKNINQILKELGLDKTTDIDSLIDRLDTVADSEINAIKSISVKTLPTTVANQEEAVKRRMYGVVTDEDKGAVSLINKRTAIIHKLLELLREEKDTNVEEINDKLAELRNYVDDDFVTMAHLNPTINGAVKTANDYADTINSNTIDFVNQKFANLMGGEDINAFYDTIKEIADALVENEEIVGVLNDSIANKANSSYVKELEERVKYLEEEKNTTVGTVVDDTLVLFNAVVVGDTLVIKDGYVTSDEEGNQTLHIGGLYD